MKILLIEDNPADARLVREMLRDSAPQKFVVVHGLSLGDALRRLSEESFDAVLLDLGLPDARGLDALRPICEAVPDVPVVVLSGHQDEELALEAVQCGAQDYLMKGIGDPGILTRAVRYAVERKRAELRIHHIAHHDGLTNLPNRRLLLDRLGQSLARTRRERKMLALVFLDIDDFKGINDTLGHAAGDELLVKVAARLSACMRESDTVARLGGDEFTLVLPEIARVEEASRFATKILAAFATPFDLAGRQVPVTASMGISLYPHDGDTVESLLRTSDAAMYRAKEHGRRNFEFHSPRPDIGPEWALLGGSLTRALERDEFMLHYQPLIDARTRECVGAEALLRWNHPLLGPIPPARFVPLAEEMGLIIPIGEWVLRTSCAQALTWLEAGLGSGTRLSVNLSGREFGNKNLRSMIRGVLDDTKFPPSRLAIELTENGMMHDEIQTRAALVGLTDMGIGIAIDDFGTGYSSLSRLKRFPICSLKIDRSFVGQIYKDPSDHAIVSAIIAMAHRLDLEVTAEGVETSQQAETLSQHGCDEMQGYFFGKPQSAEDLFALLSCEGRGAA